MAPPINEAEVVQVRLTFRHYLELGSLRGVACPGSGGGRSPDYQLFVKGHMILSDKVFDEPVAGDVGGDPHAPPSAWC